MATTAPETIYDFDAKSIEGKPAHLATQKGKVLLIVNTASKCGFTPQFAGLEELWETYRDRGLVVIGFPSNQFGAQDPGSDQEIASFCEMNYGVTFPMMSKVDVNGNTASPLWKWLTAKAPGILGTRTIKWNWRNEARWRLSSFAAGAAGLGAARRPAVSFRPGFLTCSSTSSRSAAIRS